MSTNIPFWPIKHIQIRPGVSLKRAAELAVMYADCDDSLVVFVFNGIELRALKDTDPDRIVLLYLRGCEERGQYATEDDDQYQEPTA